MPNWSAGKLTNAGLALQAKVESGTALQLTKFKLGDGGESIDNTSSLTNLVSAKTEVGISSVLAKGAAYTVTGALITANVSADFYARELGLFAQDPDDGEILYMIAIDTKPDYISDSSSTTIATTEYSLTILAANTSSDVAVEITPNGVATNDALTKAACLLQRDAEYNVGDTVYDMQLSPGLYLYCTRTGQTAHSVLNLANTIKGDTKTDGTCEWQIRAITSCWDEGTDGNITLV